MNKKIASGNTLVCESRNPEIETLTIYIDSVEDNTIIDVYGEKFYRDKLGEIYSKFTVLK